MAPFDICKNKFFLILSPKIVGLKCRHDFYQKLVKLRPYFNLTLKFENRVKELISCPSLIDSFHEFIIDNIKLD